MTEAMALPGMYNRYPAAFEGIAKEEVFCYSFVQQEGLPFAVSLYKAGLLYCLQFLIPYTSMITTYQLLYGFCIACGFMGFIYVYILTTPTLVFKPKFLYGIQGTALLPGE